ncbi:MAG: tetratricopeptide repeat protein [Bacteroidales bacterium]|nr:tetratricopeptide repeat protein [Bacteroidales bacterium]
MIKIIRAIVLTAIISTSGLIHLHAQKSEIYSNNEEDFYKGLELFEKEKYGAARNFFDKTIDKYDGEKSELRAEAMYYRAMCSIELFNIDAEYLVFEFINQNPESPLINNANFRMADYMYKKKNYPRTIMYYNKVDRFLLSDDELSEYYFQKGYSHYKRSQFEDARVNFYEIKDTDNKFASPALYYYSHIAYDQGNYETALQGFKRLLNDETFSVIAPYYISQILYFQKKFREVVEFAPPLMDSVSVKRVAELSKIIGESYFYLGEYKEAIPYLQKYKDMTKTSSIQDKYQLAFSYYMAGDYKEAAVLFERISMTDTEISMSALYNLADCYIKLGEKDKARTAFGSASRMNFNQQIEEDALFNYAKLSYELSYSPFNEAVRTLNYYIRQYPASPRVDEVYNILVLAYMETKNYKLAMESLEKIKNKDADIEKAYQKVAFFRGMELFVNSRFSDAISAFDKSAQYGQYDNLIYARTLYWLAESYYMYNDVNTARDYYRLFLDEPASFKTPEYKKVKYSMAYIEFSKANYSVSEKLFREYVSLEEVKTSATIADAYNRIADCRYINSSYWEAIDNYDKVIKLNKADVDYAYFQKAFSLGLVDRPERKIETLKELLAANQTSSYTDDALFEIARTYVLLENPGLASQNYKKLIAEFPNSNYISKAYIQLGLIEKNAGNNDAALGYYKKVVNDYPGTPEANNSLNSIKDIYVTLNNVDGYLAYAEKIGSSLSISEQDSLMYISAENVYLEGNCEKAVKNLNDYINRYEKGAFLLNAHYYLSDCLLKLGKQKEAMQSLMFVINQPTGIFTEVSLLAACRISYSEKDFNQAAELYRKLIDLGENKANISEAEIGIMRSYARLGEYQNTIDAGRIVLLQDKLEPSVKTEANYLIANAYLLQNDLVSAYEWYSKISHEVNTIYGAEAKYRVAEIDYGRNEKAKAESTVLNMVKLNTPHHFWMGKTFLLLSDIYLDKDDEYQAVQTLESIINYYPVENDGIKAEAISRKAVIVDQVNSESRENNPDTMEIEMGGGN